MLSCIDHHSGISPPFPLCLVSHPFDLAPLSENNSVLLEVLKTIKPHASRNTPSEKHKASPAKKRSSGESQGKGKQPAKRFKFGGKGKKDCSSPKPSTSKAAVSPP